MEPPHRNASLHAEVRIAEPPGAGKPSRGCCAALRRERRNAAWRLFDPAETCPVHALSRERPAGAV
jgi:hypothetical protein